MDGVYEWNLEEEQANHQEEPLHSDNVNVDKIDLHGHPLFDHSRESLEDDQKIEFDSYEVIQKQSKEEVDLVSFMDDEFDESEQPIDVVYYSRRNMIVDGNVQELTKRYGKKRSVNEKDTCSEML